MCQTHLLYCLHKIIVQKLMNVINILRVVCNYIWWYFWNKTYMRMWECDQQLNLGRECQLALCVKQCTGEMELKWIHTKSTIKQYKTKTIFNYGCMRILSQTYHEANYIVIHCLCKVTSHSVTLNGRKLQATYVIYTYIVVPTHVAACIHIK